MPESIRDRATKAHEYVFHLTRSERYFFDLEAWSEKALAAGSKMPDGWDTGKGGHGSFHRNGREKGTKRNSFARTTKDSAGQHGQRPQFRPEREVVDYSLTRNKRSVWTVPTVAYSEAHYATYPPRLITPPILASTSAKGCCSQCGKPWERVVEKTDVVNPAHKGSRFDAGKTSERPAHGMDTVQKGERYLKQPTDRWQPTCQCQPGTENGELRTSIVLDPFGGSGTTAQVALEHGRHAILIERGPHNIALIRKRLAPVLAAPVLHLA